MVKPVKYPLVIEGMDPSRIIYENRTSKWTRVVAHWNQEAGQGRVITHKVGLVVNAQTRKIYNDDQKSLMAFKFALISVGTPLYLLAKTVYHILLPVSIPHKIYETYQQVQKEKIEAAKAGKAPPKDLTKRVFKEIGKNLLDIVRTPFYAVALTTIAVATLLFSAIRTQTLYDGRAAYGHLQESLNWGDRKSIWVLAPCMLSLRTLEYNAQIRTTAYPYTQYEGETGSILFGLNNIARSYAYNGLKTNQEAYKSANLD